MTNLFYIITNEMLIKKRKKNYCFIIRIDNKKIDDRILNPLRSNLFFFKKIVYRNYEENYIIDLVFFF